MKTVQRCVALSQLLVEQNFPAIAIHRGMAQEERYHCCSSPLLVTIALAYVICRESWSKMKLKDLVFFPPPPAGYPGTSSLRTSSGGSLWPPTCLVEEWTSSVSTLCSTTTCQRILTHTFTESVLLSSIFLPYVLFLQAPDSVKARFKSLCCVPGGPCWKIRDQRLGHHLCF